jgi:hypothetical protein
MVRPRSFRVSAVSRAEGIKRARILDGRFEVGT